MVWGLLFVFLLDFPAGANNNNNANAWNVNNDGNINNNNVNNNKVVRPDSCFYLV